MADLSDETKEEARRKVALIYESVSRARNLKAEYDLAANRKVRFVAICSNDETTHPDDSFENMKKYAAEWGLNFPYVRDEDQSVARAFGAERTPEIFALDNAGVCRYEGGIDDNYQDAGAVTQRPLANALTALVAGETVAEPTSYAIGCTIKWKA